MSWTKGHASWKHILAHDCNALAIANGQADLASDLAPEAWEKGPQHDILEYHALKQHCYEKIIGRLQIFAA